MDRGELVPDEMTLALVMERLASPTHGMASSWTGSRARGRRPRRSTSGWPRGRHLDRVINLVVPDDVLLARLSGRWLCRDCHASYHELFSPPTSRRL